MCKHGEVVSINSLLTVNTTDTKMLVRMAEQVQEKQRHSYRRMQIRHFAEKNYQFFFKSEFSRIKLNSNADYNGRKEGLFYLTTHSTHSIQQLYGVGLMVKDHSDSERGIPLPPHGLLFPISSKVSFKCSIPQTG